MHLDLFIKTTPRSNLNYNEFYTLLFYSIVQYEETGGEREFLCDLHDAISKIN